MTPEQFVRFADPLPEPMLLLSGSGVVLNGNRAVEQRLGVALAAIRGRQLADVVTDAPDEIARYLRSCARSRSLVFGALEVRVGNGACLACRTEGALLQPRTDESEAVLLLRLIPKDSAVGQFVALNRRIEELNEENRRRRVAEMHAREQAEQLRVTLRSIGDAVIVSDTEGRVRLLNAVAQHMTGWTQDEAMGEPLTSVFRIINELTRLPVENPALRALREGVVVGLENHTLLVAKDGTERPIDDSGAPICADDGTLLGSILVFRDVTQRHATEARLRRSEQQFRQLADSMPQIVWSAEPDGIIDYLNRQWTDFTGLEEMSGNSGWSQVMHPDESQAAREQWEDSLRRGAPFEMQLRLLERQTGTYRWHLFRTIPVHDDAGDLVRWFGSATDIHEQKRAEESARYLAEASAALADVGDYERTLRTVANLAVPHFADWSAVDLADDHGTLRRLAVAHQDADKVELAHVLMRDYPPDPNAPNGAVEVLRTRTPEMVSEITDDMLVRGSKDETHLRLIRSLGLKSYICVPLIVSGEPIGVLTFATAQSGRTYNSADLTIAMDLAHRASVAVENARLYQELRDADRRKDEFLATLAHELRNPLAPIHNALQILKMPSVDASMVARSREMMERQVAHLVRLVDDLLDVSRVMRGKIELRRERMELATVVARAVEMVQPLVDARGLHLGIDLPSESVLMDADPVRLAQVVGNLLTNAAKYSVPGGRIRLTAVRENGTVQLSVTDTGIGISAQLLPRIFDLFVQEDHASSNAHGGLGIGLTLVKNLVEMHRGTVEGRSQGLGRGSEFIVRLPTAIGAEAAGAKAAGAKAAGADHRTPSGLPTGASTSASGLRLLVVDDNQDAADSLAVLLELQGHEVRVAYSGQDALTLAQAYTPDIVFLDIGMPGMNGFELADRLRQQPLLQHVVLAALTGWGQKEDRRRTSDAGFHHHLVKPPAPHILDAVIADVMRVRKAQGTATGFSPKQ